MGLIMTTRYYIDADGNYLGGFSDGNPDIPQGAIEVLDAPENIMSTFVNGAWQLTEAGRKSLIKEEIEAIERRELMPRKTREIQIQVMLYFGQQQGLTHDQIYAVNPAYKGMVDVDNQIKALRAQL